MKFQVLLMVSMAGAFLASEPQVIHKAVVTVDAPPQKLLPPPAKRAARKEGIAVLVQEKEDEHKKLLKKSEQKLAKQEKKEERKEERREFVQKKREEAEKRKPELYQKIKELSEEKKLKDERHLAGFQFPSFGSFGNFGNFGLSKAWSVTDKTMGEANTMTKGKGNSGLTITTDSTSAGANGSQGSMAGGNFMNTNNSWAKDLFTQSAFPAPAQTSGAGIATAEKPKETVQAAGFDIFKTTFGDQPFGMKSAWMKTGQTMADSQSMAMGDGNAQITAGKTGVTANANGLEGTANKGSFANSLDAWSDESASHFKPDEKAAVPADPVNTFVVPTNLLAPAAAPAVVALTPPLVDQPALTQLQVAPPQAQDQQAQMAQLAQAQQAQAQQAQAQQAQAQAQQAQAQQAQAEAQQAQAQQAQAQQAQAQQAQAQAQQAQAQQAQAGQP